MGPCFLGFAAVAAQVRQSEYAKVLAVRPRAFPEAVLALTVARCRFQKIDF